MSSPSWMRRRLLFWHWYSFCPRPHYSATCKQCAYGEWVFRPALALSSLIFKLNPELWRKWKNRPNSRARRKLEKHFPNELAERQP